MTAAMRSCTNHITARQITATAITHSFWVGVSVSIGPSLHPDERGGDHLQVTKSGYVSQQSTVTFTAGPGGGRMLDFPLQPG